MALVGVPAATAAALQTQQALHLPPPQARIGGRLPGQWHQGGHGGAVPLNHDALAGRGPLQQLRQALAGGLHAKAGF